MTKEEPVAYFDPQEGGFYWAKPTRIEALVSVDVEPLLLYTTPQGCDECGVGGGYALYCLVCAEKYVKPEWVGLTDEEIDQGLLRSFYALQSAGAWREGVAWAEEILKEKNNAV